MWTVIYMAKNKNTAEKVENKLKEEGFLVKVRPVVKNNEENDSFYEVSVPESEVLEAHEVIAEHGL